MKIIALALGATLALAIPVLAQAQSAVGVGVGTGVANSSSNSGSSARGNVSNYKNPRQAPGVGLAGLAASSGCLGSASVGGSGIGFGFGFGGTYQDDRCNAREDARLLYSMGYRRQAVQILVNHSPMVQEVMAATPVSAGPARSQQVRYVAASTAQPRHSAANGGDPDATCAQWVGGVVGGRCAYR